MKLTEEAYSNGNSSSSGIINYYSFLALYFNTNNVLKRTSVWVSQEMMEKRIPRQIMDLNSKGDLKERYEH